MAEDPVFSGFSNGDAASVFASTIAGIKADMAAIERSAKSIEKSLSRASKSKISTPSSGVATGSGKTGESESTGMRLGDISVPGGIRTAAFGVGALAGGWGGGIALAGFGDLRVGPNRALDFEAARFGVAQATGQFSSFQNIIDSARTDFNVQNERAFMESIVSATQRGGMIGLMGGGTVGERKAGQIVGGFGSLAAMAGIDQSTVGNTMNSMYGAPAYYSALAAGIQTRNPVTGELASSESIVNQMWASTGMGGKTGEAALRQIDIDYGYGGMGRAQLLEMFGGDENAVQTVVEGLRLRAQSGENLKEGAIEEQARAAGLLGTEETQGMEKTRELESARLRQTGEYVNDVTEGVAAAADHLSDAVNLLTDLEGPLRDIVGAMEGFAAEMDVFQTEVPGLTRGLTDFFGNLPNLLLSLVLLRGAGLPGLMTKSGALSMSKVLKTGAKGAARLLPGAGVALGGELGINALQNAAGVGEEGHDFSAVDALGTIGASAGTYAAGGALVGSAILPGVGTAVGAIGGTIFGVLKGVLDSVKKESEDFERNPDGKAEGDWFVEKDQNARIHYGEMVLPNRVADAVREELALGQTSGPISNRTSPKKRDGDTTVNIYLTVQQASDQEAMMFASRVKRIMEDDNELLSIGSGRF